MTWPERPATRPVDELRSSRSAESRPTIVSASYAMRHALPDLSLPALSGVEGVEGYLMLIWALLLRLRRIAVILKPSQLFVAGF